MNCNIKYTTLFAQLRGKNNNKTKKIRKYCWSIIRTLR